MDGIALVEEQLREIRPILSGDAGDEGHSTIIPHDSFALPTKDPCGTGVLP